MRTSNAAQLEFDSVSGVIPPHSLESNGAPSHPVALPVRHADQDVRKQVFRLGAQKSDRTAIPGNEPLSMAQLLTFGQAARVLGISLRQFRRLVDGGKLPFIKVSERSPRISPTDLQRFLAASVVKYSQPQS